VDTALLPRWIWPRAAYVHVPFCAHHCGYCDFAVATGQDHWMDLYVEALSDELATLGSPQAVETLFLGGGTPTYLDCRALDYLLTAVIRWLPLVPGHEFTVEANPGTIDAEKVAVLSGHGVTRVSLGAQSFHLPLLRVLERDHHPEAVRTAVEKVRARIREVSLDLIFGVPGQTVEQWEKDIRQALDLQPDHISTYGLTYEKGTRLWKQRQRGEICPLDEEAERTLYLHALDTLTGAGFEHYEISNFARPGRRSRHNQVYWANEAYFGFGLGAARYVRRCREVNTRSLRDYLRKALHGQSVVFQAEELGPEERARETLVLQLRRAEGVDRRRFAEQTEYDLDRLAGPALARHAALGLIGDDGSRVWLTREGKCVADALAADLL
jgi:oxygen-independent coproporphyrinogen-3 oxidase